MTRTIMYFVLFLIPILAKAQIITTFAGGGVAVGDNGPATMALIQNPNSGVFDTQGNFYIVSKVGNRIRKVDVNGIITTIAGTGTSGYNGDGIPASMAQVYNPEGIALDTSGNIIFADAGNNRIRKIEINSGIITTVAGDGVANSYGDNGSATAAALNNPIDVCVDLMNNIYVVDNQNNKIRKINSFGVISTYVGTGIFGFNGDGTQATSAQLWLPSGIATDTLGNFYIADWGNKRVRKVDKFGIISTIAGLSSGFLHNGENIPASNAQMDPIKVSADNFGNLYVSDWLNYRVRIISASGIISTIAGTGTSGFSGDGGAAALAQLSYPSGVAIDTCGNVYISEANNNRIRKVTFPKCHYLNVKETKQDAKEGINVFPNPANNELTITAPVEIKSVRVVDMVGQSFDMLTMTARKNEMVLNIRHLPAGVYVVRVNGIYFRKFVKE